jgi:hypothetical protein
VFGEIQLAGDCQEKQTEQPWFTRQIRHIFDEYQCATHPGYLKIDFRKSEKLMRVVITDLLVSLALVIASIGMIAV